MENKNDSLKASFRHAFDGLGYAFKTQRNMKIHFAVTIAVVTCSVVFGLPWIQKAILAAMCGAVIMAELFNTAIENAVDICAPEFNMYAKQAKDAAAGAVLVISIAAAIVGIIIFFPCLLRLIDLIQHLI